MRFLKKLVFRHNLGRARYFKTEKDKAERARNRFAAAQNDALVDVCDERLRYCERELKRYLRALGQEA